MIHVGGKDEDIGVVAENYWIYIEPHIPKNKWERD